MCVYLVFVCLFCFGWWKLRNVLRVLRHIGMIHDENIREERTARPSSEWLKNSGAKRWGDDFPKKPKWHII